MSEIELQPEGYKLIVKPEEIKQKTEGGIYLPDSTRDQEQNAVNRGEVVAIGPSCSIQFDGDDLAVGDTIVFAKYGGFLVERKDGNLRILNDEDVVARVK